MLKEKERESDCTSGTSGLCVSATWLHCNAVLRFC